MPNFDVSLKVGKGKLLNLSSDGHFERHLYPYLLGCTNSSADMWVIGESGQGMSINSFYAKTILNLDSIDCVLVPDAPGDVLECLGELLHTGRFVLLSF